MKTHAISLVNLPIFSCLTLARTYVQSTKNFSHLKDLFMVLAGEESWVYVLQQSEGWDSKNTFACFGTS